MNNFLSVFVGVPQSRYAALAILIAVIVVSLVILVSKDTVPVSQKFGFIFLVFLVSLPGLALSLFQLTCIVTGAGFKNKRWWCSLYAWIIAAMMIFYAVILVLGAILSITAPEPHKYARKLTPTQFNDMMLNANNLTLDALANDENIVSESVYAEVPVHDVVARHDEVPENDEVPEHDEVPQVPQVQQVQQYIQPVVQPAKPTMPTNNHQVQPLVHSMRHHNAYPMTLDNDQNEQFINGDKSIASEYPGMEIAVLPYAPGAEVNGLLFPLPTQPSTEKFYAPFESDLQEEEETM